MTESYRWLSPFGGLTVLVWLLAFTGQVSAQDRDEDEAFLPGLLVRYQDAKGNRLARIEPHLAFHHGENGPDPRLTTEEWRATWQGQLRVGTGGAYRFLLFAHGEVELKVGGQVVVAKQLLRNEWRETAAVTLAGDYQPLELSFRRIAKDARLMVLWSGPQFGWEPLPPRLLFHPREQSPGTDYPRGQLLARALRCDHCHGGDKTLAPGPALNRLAGNMSRDWLVRWLGTSGHGQTAPEPNDTPRRMPTFALTAGQAEAIADWLLAPRKTEPPPAPPSTVEKKLPADKKKPAAPKIKPDAKRGERLFLTLGCLACHGWRDLGAGGWFGGGDLTAIAAKRPASFFAAWLADPARLNRDHRMPVFALSNDERTALALFLAEQEKRGQGSGVRSQGAGLPFSAQLVPANAEREARKLVEQFRCGACHHLPDSVPAAGPLPRLGAKSKWEAACLTSAHRDKQRPAYWVSESDTKALRVYYSQRGGRTEPVEGRTLLVENNCLACHAREGKETLPLLPPLLADKLAKLGQRYADLATLTPALTPPALTSVGDKLTDQALVEAIARTGPAYRSYLQVRMPRFKLHEDELQRLTRHFLDADRVTRKPNDQGEERGKQSQYALVGGRLLSSDGFGCTSCHQVGSVLPSQGPLSTRGPNLSQLNRRIRREWFDRFVRNPARIMPFMEMPSVQLPVAGVLTDRLDDQLAAVWHVLNVPGFEPPAPNPLRILRHAGHEDKTEPLLLTDILQQGERVWLKPFFVGLPNRHNVLLDLESGGLSLWTVGDLARQRTKGKSWYWELAGTPIFAPGFAKADLSLIHGDKELTPQLRGQFFTEADSWQSDGPSISLQYRLTFAPSPEHTLTVPVQRRWTPVTESKTSGFIQELSAGPLPPGSRLRLRVLPNGSASPKLAHRIVVREPAGARLGPDGTIDLSPNGLNQTGRVVLAYLAEVPVDRFPETSPSAPLTRKVETVEVAPGFRGERLPLPSEIMPMALSWRPNGRLVFASLRGQVFEAIDSDRDGHEDQLVLLADGLPNPYGIHAETAYVDVSAKYGLLRIWNPTKNGRRVETIASGWGYTQDYHDWAIGLPRNDRGHYFLGIPCQQDKRAAAAARFHGQVVRLVPRKPTADDPRLFQLETISAGHRFPTGLALNQAGELFVTDNQGNYNPFNELNHVRPGIHFGFINTLDRGKPMPPLTPPAIDIPHPWTRSVNGICFLDTPKDLRAKLGRDVFGLMEGHLIGCEYDTRRLIRMSLQRVGDTFQGAAYPLSILPSDPGNGFMGPVSCAVSPRGELHIGSLRDSGWGAGNNVGEIIRVRLEPDKLPCGIAEVRATKDGFVIAFFRPVDPLRANRLANYAVESYRRESTPAYGGPDRDRRTEKVAGVTVADDCRRVTLKLTEWRPGFVYELRLQNLAPGRSEFYPAEAHYTLRQPPK